jgi:hypothetical protein
VFHPILFSLIPILTLLGHNAKELRPSDSLRVIASALVVAFGCLIVFRLLLRRWDRAAIFSTLAVLILLSYGHLYHTLREVVPNGIQIIRHRYMIPLLLALLIGSYAWLRKQQNINALTSYLNLVAILLLIYPITQIVIAEVEFQDKNRSASTELITCRLAPIEGQTLPDIYHVVLDAYARNDVMERTYSFDNSEFLEALEARGFYVAEWSQSNYARTGISLSSTLNMSYFEDQDGEFVLSEQENYEDPLTIGNNIVRRELECIGYSIIAFDSGYYWSGWRSADIFLSPFEISEGQRIQAAVNPFESLFLYNSAGLIFLDVRTLLSDQFRDAINEPLLMHRERILYALNRTGDFVPQLPSPKYAFVHVIAPHPPFVLGTQFNPSESDGPFTLMSKGDPVQEQSEVEGYRNQVRVVNQLVLQMIDNILESSKTSPIIVIHGDHGTGSGVQDRMAILNAYYLPAETKDLLYPTISPVNSFRLIFNNIFDADFPLLEDISYFSEYETLYDFSEFPNPYSNR